MLDQCLSEKRNKDAEKHRHTFPADFLSLITGKDLKKLILPRLFCLLETVAKVV
jgi:hypothetical protein